MKPVVAPVDVAGAAVDDPMSRSLLGKIFGSGVVFDESPFASLLPLCLC